MNAVVDAGISNPSLDDAPPVPLIFTDSAASKVKELVDEEGNPELKL
ncbi:MAG: iron-sulfur cluster insertion protein ErpA, partial [Burkholderiaceae bacterium]